MATQFEKAERFVALHQRPGAFVIPNPWDIGSARLLAGLGFEALATTSSGFAHTLGRLDGEVSRAEKIAHCQVLSTATDLPISADLEQGFGDAPEAAAEAITLAAGAGMVGASIEDYSGDPARPIYDFDLAVERVAAAVEAAKTLDFPFTLTARAEALLRGGTDVDAVTRRLQAFEAAGADVLYAPALKTLDQVRTVTGALDKPVNVLSPFLKGVSVDQLAEAGAKRISIGGALARAAIGTVIRAGEEMQNDGTFSWVSGMASGSAVQKLLGS